MKNADYTKLSKVISHALRHEPEHYGLKIDNEGWANLSDLVVSLRKNGWLDISDTDILQMVEQIEKKRHQIEGDKIRAYYGHTIEENIARQSVMPPAILYHGTISGNTEKIKEHGLLPMERQYVHLSEKMDEAVIVANRWNGDIVILKINSQAANESGFPFYKEVNNIWLAHSIPPQFILFQVITEDNE